jgi:tetratricopeptide (TPR) repeat protein
VNQQEQQLPPQARTALDKCFAQIRLARATELAQSKRFLEAEAVLMLNGELPDNPRDLDLLARIAAQQGHLSDARRLWEAALQKDPHNRVYEDCLQLLTEVQDAASRFDTLLTWLVCATILFSIGALLYAFFPRH